MKLPTSILVANDLSEIAERAVDYAVTLAAKFDAKLYMVNAIPIPTMGVPEIGLAMASGVIESTISANQTELDKVVARYASTVPIKVIMNTGDPRDVIVNTATQVGAELIVIGSHGRRGISRMLLGSVAESVLRHAHCPVLVVRPE